MRNARKADFPLTGEMAIWEYLSRVADGPGNFTSYRAEWLRMSGVGEHVAIAHARRNLCETLRLMHAYDQLDLSCFASAELARYLIQSEVAAERNARRPDYSGLGIIRSALVTASGRAAVRRFIARVSDRVKERSQIWKQERLYRRERRSMPDGDGGGGKGQGQGQREEEESQ